MNAKLAVLVGGLMMMGAVGGIDAGTMGFAKGMVFALIGTACAIEGALRLTGEQA
jgi:hypothetical protein|tara:strand:+ start:2380 stop:2544 length:165 start_codon:yes stop_codon:yes gene_type:complete